MRRNNIYIDAVVQTLILFALSLAVGGVISLLCSCRTCKPIETHETIMTGDSLREKTVYVETLRIDTVTVTVEIPAQSTEQITHDSISHLETDFALSDAWIASDGSLGHTLHNKPQTIETSVPVTAKDRFIGNERQKIRNVVVNRTKTVTQTVEKPIKWWQAGLMWSGGIALSALMALAVVWIARNKKN